MFNPNDYETVEERLRRFWADEANADARIITINRTTDQDRQVSTWVVETRIYLNREDHAADLPKATGWAFEVDGGKGANQTSALENCETSSIGRCLGNMNYSGNKRATREEMEKVQRGVTPQAARRVVDIQLPPAQVAAIDDAERNAIVHAIATAPNKATLRQIWKANTAILDQAWQNSLGDMVSLKALIVSRQAEVPEEATNA
jgi:hypothetical protein